MEGDRFNRFEVSNDCFDQSGYRQFAEAAADMSTNDLPDEPRPLPAWRFASTRWSIVAAAGRKESAEARAALAVLCQTYWYPLYAYARRRLARPDDAQDLTQEFFA